MTQRNTVVLTFCILLAMVIAFFILAPHHPKPMSNHVFTNQSKIGAPPAESGQITVYLSRNLGQATLAQPTLRTVDAALLSTPEEKLSTAIRQLLKGPTSAEKTAGFYSEIPAHTRLQSITRTPEGWMVDLSPSFTSGGGSTTMELRLEELKKTISATHPQQPVSLRVAGQLVTVLGGEGVMVHEPLVTPLTKTP